MLPLPVNRRGVPKRHANHIQLQEWPREVCQYLPKVNGFQHFIFPSSLVSQNGSGGTAPFSWL